MITPENITKPLKALIVEDVHFIGLILQRVITPYGFCEFAASGIEAVEKYTRAFTENDPFNLICLDILLPEMDGFEVLRSIRHFEDGIGLPQDLKVKIIVISTFNDKNTVSKARRAGCDRYISKPFSMKKVLEEIQLLGLINVAPPPEIKQDIPEKKDELTTDNDSENKSS